MVDGKLSGQVAGAVGRHPDTASGSAPYGSRIRDLVVDWQEWTHRQIVGMFDINIIFTWHAAVIASIVVAFPLMYKTARGAFEQIDPNILNAARTLGVSEWKVFWRVSVPLARPGIAAATALAFARSMGEFGATLMVAGSIPGQTQTIPIAIYFATLGGEMRVALFWVLVILSISLTVIVIMNNWNNAQRKLKLGAGGK